MENVINFIIGYVSFVIGIIVVAGVFALIDMLATRAINYYFKQLDAKHERIERIRNEYLGRISVALEKRDGMTALEKKVQELDGRQDKYTRTHSALYRDLESNLNILRERVDEQNREYLENIDSIRKRMDGISNVIDGLEKRVKELEDFKKYLHDECIF